jgi:hypothetical protein
MSGESGKSTLDPNARQEVRTSISSTPDETTVETIVIGTIEHETENKTSTEPSEISEKNYTSKEPLSEKQIPTEQNTILEDVREKVIDAPTVVQTIETLTAHTNDNAKSAQPSQSSDSSKKDNHGASEKSTNDISEVSPHAPRIQFTEQEKPDHVNSEAVSNSTNVESTTKTLPNKEASEASKADETTKKHVDIVSNSLNLYSFILIGIFLFIYLFSVI